MPFATVGEGRRLYYRFDGPEGAPVVLFSNSLGCDLGLWDAQAEALAARGLRVLRYDTRGHGLSDAPAGDYRMDDLARDVVALLDGLGVSSVRFCGLSMGGAIGQWLGAEAGARIERLVLANTGATFGSRELWRQRIETVRVGGMAAVVEAVIQRWVTPGFAARAPEAVARLRAMLAATSAQGYAGCCAALRDVDYRARLARIAAPTLVIGGEHDTATPPASARELAKAIPGARLVMLDAAHLAPVEQEAAFTAALIDFLG